MVSAGIGSAQARPTAERSKKPLLPGGYLKSAAAYLVELARSSKGGRYRKSAKIDALREWKEEILEAHRSGISIHRIAQIFRERRVKLLPVKNGVRERLQLVKRRKVR